jgi:ketosteroid isomerase-like protein
LSSSADEATVWRWFDAFNSRDLKGMLACMHPNVDFHPLRLPGVIGDYHGHEGLREWFSTLQRMAHEHRIELSETSSLGEGRVIAAGALVDAGGAGRSSFWALERLEAGLIVSERHHLSDRFHLR